MARFALSFLLAATLVAGPAFAGDPPPRGGGANTGGGGGGGSGSSTGGMNGHGNTGGDGLGGRPCGRGAQISITANNPCAPGTPAPPKDDDGPGGKPTGGPNGI